jgi:hypothetical protein
MIAHYVPLTRLDRFDEAIKHKLSYLEHHPYLTGPLVTLPDFGDDGFGLNGLSFASQDVVFTMGAGKDVGCGFRVLRIQKATLDALDLTSFITRTFKTFAQSVISQTNTPSIKYIESLCNEGELLFDRKRKSELPFEAMSRYFGQVAKGNHFIEFRFATENSSLFSKGDLLIHIHSGSGVDAEEAMLSYHARFYPVDTPQDPNGYLAYRSTREDLAKNYLADATRLLHFAKANRAEIQEKLDNWLGAQTELILDTAHDRLDFEGDTIRYFKAAQTYAPYRDSFLAMIPTTISQNSYLVRQISPFPYVNHGVGDGELGSPMSYSNVLTNFKDSSNRKFFDADSVMEIGIRNKWFEVITELSPWICIKNRT